MSINNLYLGATHTIAGASYLNSKTIMNVQEGYDYGTSLEYVNIGDFEVEEINNGGAFSQRISLTARSPIDRLDQNNLFFTQVLNNGVVVLDEFDNQENFNRNWTKTEGNAFEVIKNGNVLGISMPAVANNYHIFETSNPILDNGVRVIMKHKWIDIGAQGGNLGLMWNVEKPGTEGTNSGYLLNIRPDLTYMELLRVDNGAYTTLGGSIATSSPVNTYRWAMITHVNGRIRTYTSTNDLGTLYTLKHDVVDTTYDGGFVGLRANGKDIFYGVDSMDITEIGSHVSTQEVMRTSLAMGGVYETDIEWKWEGFSGFGEGGNGASWTLGGSNELTFHGGYSTGSSLAWYVSGSSYSDFEFEFEFKGASGSVVGSYVGTSDSYYTTSINFKVDFEQEQGNTIEHVLGQSKYQYTKRGQYTEQRANHWYKLNIVKTGTLIKSYMNGLLINSMWGTSLTDVDNVSIGVVGQLAASGITNSLFRNFRISALDQSQDDVHIPTNQPLSTTFDRYLPKGFASNWSGNKVDIFEIGASRGQQNTGLSDYQSRANRVISNVGSHDMILVSGQDSISRKDSTVNRIALQVDSGKYRFVNDISLENLTDTQNFADAETLFDKKKASSIEVEVSARVNIEKYDKINYVNEVLGISEQMTIYNQRKSYEAEDGEFTHSIELA